MKMINKFAAAFAVLAVTAGAQAATTSIGAVSSATDFLAGTDGTVTYGKGVSFSDTYSFTLALGEDVTGFAQAVGGTKYTLTGGAGELELFSGTASGTHSLVDEATFSTSGLSLSDSLAAGSYYYEVVGKASGANGGKYYFEVTAVPEPTNVALMLAGLGMIGGLARRRRQG